MENKKYARIVLAAIMLSLISYGCTTTTDQTAQSAKPTVQTEQKKKTVFKGPIVGKSNKAKTISIQLGKGDSAKTMMVKFDENTTGLEYAKKGEAAIIEWEQRGADKFATVVKPKLAKLPEGVTEIKVEEMHDLWAAKTPMTLVDARPELRYNQGHLPGAISIPVPKLKKMKAEVLPEDKNKLIVFYCGGPT